MNLEDVAAYVFPAASMQSITSKVYGPFLPTEAQVNAQVKAQLRTSMIEKEGYRLDVYRDTRGYLTVGIGHRVETFDNLSLGDKITDKKAEELFESDVSKALTAAKIQAKELKKYTVNMVLALTHVNFQLGIYWRTKFKNTWELLKQGRWQAAVNNLRQSAWATQTPVRVTAFINAIKQEYA